MQQLPFQDRVKNEKRRTISTTDADTCAQHHIVDSVRPVDQIVINSYRPQR